MPDFFVESDVKKPQWLEHLEKHGVTVVKNTLSEEDVKYTRQKFWEWLDTFSKKKQEDMKKKHDIDIGTITIGDQSTISDDFWPSNCSGITREFFSNHQEAAWFIRTRPNVKKCFEQIWETDDLITSYDCFFVWR